MGKQSRYPSFHVMKEQENWDEHTRSIVSSRLESGEEYQFLTSAEAETVRRICSLLVNDPSPEVLDFVVGHIDRSLYRSPGEGQRKAGVPQAPDLIRTGLKAIEQGARSEYGRSFAELEREGQQQYLQQISAAAAEPQHIWRSVPQKALFEKLQRLTVESYCSHPNVWSEIGYAGPAYPRGYVRTQLGQLDPWEAQPER